MFVSEFIEEAEKLGIVLGKNPARTIRYYIELGILERPEIKQIGKKRAYCFNSDHLILIQLVHYYKAQGYTLSKIKEWLSDKLYWTDNGIEFIKPYIEKQNIPDDSFKSGNIVTRGQMFVLLSVLVEMSKEKEIKMPDIGMFFSDKEGNPLEIPDFILGKN